LDFDIKGSMLEALEKSDSDLDNQYNDAGPSCDSLPATGTSGTIDDFMAMQTNFGSFTSLVRAVEDVPLSRIMQDQVNNYLIYFSIGTFSISSNRNSLHRFEWVIMPLFSTHQ
jgi:hypothetical protein